MQWILDFIRPPEDATWKAVNRWRWNVTITLLVLCVLASVVYVRGVVFAGDLKKEVAEAVDKKMKPVVEEQVQQRILLNTMNTLLINQLLNTKAAEIRLNISQWCQAKLYADRDALMKERDRLQGEYRTLHPAKEFYRELKCGDL